MFSPTPKKNNEEYKNQIKTLNTRLKEVDTKNAYSYLRKEFPRSVEKQSKPTSDISVLIFRFLHIVVVYINIYFDLLERTGPLKGELETQIFIKCLPREQLVQCP